jgi:hypothetical protein
VATPADLNAAAQELRDIASFPVFAYTPSLTAWMVLGAIVLGALLVMRVEWRRKQRGPDPFVVVATALGGPVSRDTVFAVSRSVKRLLAAYRQLDVAAFTGAELSREAERTTDRLVSAVLTDLAALEGVKFGPFDPQQTGVILARLRDRLPEMRGDGSVERGHGGLR